MSARAHHEIVRLARSQNGAIAVDQLLAAGLTHSAIKARVDRGRLVRLYRGVYVLGDPALLPLARPAAALLALGPGSVLSHRWAAVVWGVIEADPPFVDITVTGPNRRARPGIRVHRTSGLHPDDVGVRSNLRITSPARTMIDLAGDSGRFELEQAFGEARAHRLITDHSLDEALARAPQNHLGRAVVRAMLRDNWGSTRTRSGAERELRKLLRQAGLPQPQVNVPLLGYTADFLWPEYKLIVETDGFGTHGDRSAFEKDRRRDQVHVAAGYVVIRVTYRQLEDEPFGVIARVTQALALRAVA